MSIRVLGGVDLLPAAGAVLAAVMAGVYIDLIRGQGDRPLPWVLVAFGVGALAAAYGSVVVAPLHRASLIAGAVVLLALGVVALLTIGLPILMAGGLVLAGAVRTRR